MIDKHDNAVEEMMVPVDSSSTPSPLDQLKISDEDLRVCLEVIQKFHSDEGYKAFPHPRFKALRKALIPLSQDMRKQMFFGQTLTEHTSRKEKKRKLKIERAREKARDEKMISSTTLRAARWSRLESLINENPLLPMIPDGAVDDQLYLEHKKEDETELSRAMSCYICKNPFKVLHHFYDQLCPECAELNYQKRFQSTNLQGRIAIVTGARVKIGYEIGLKLLRAGTVVIATTRFPRDASIRYAQEKDFDQWKDRLHIYGMDFRDLGVIEKFMLHVETRFGYLDILINNATQTIRRPTHYYKHLLDQEMAPFAEEQEHLRSILMGNTEMAELGSSMHTKMHALPPSNGSAGENVSQLPKDIQVVASSVLQSQVPLTKEDQANVDSSALYPQGQYDVNNQQLDLRKKNSWVLKLPEVDTMELVEVFAINTMAPFILNRKAIPLLEKSKAEHKFIINVSAMEGKFYRPKSANHPHTNMAKAAVNMMTRTSACELAQNQKIYMNSVDTGWINDENPRDIAVKKVENHNFQTPLDEIDAAARVLDPILGFYQDKNEDPVPIYGRFLKDYKLSEW